MAQIHIIDQESPEPFGSIARVADVAMYEANKRWRYLVGTDYRDLPEPTRSTIHSEVCRRTRELLGQE